MQAGCSSSPDGATAPVSHINGIPIPTGTSTEHRALSCLTGRHKAHAQLQERSRTSAPFPACQLSTDNVFAVGEAKSLTTTEICELIADKVSKYRSTFSALPNERFPTNSRSLAGCTAPQSTPTITPLCREDGRSLACSVLKPRITTTAQPLEDRLKISKSNSESNPKPKERDDLSAKKRSPEYPQILREVSGTCTKNQDRGPVIVPVIVPDGSGGTGGPTAGKYPGLTLTCSSSEHRSGLNVQNNLDNSVVTRNNLLPVKHVKDPCYEDVSEAEDSSEMITKPPKAQLYKSTSKDGNVSVPLREVYEPSINQIKPGQIQSFLSWETSSREDSSLRQNMDDEGVCSSPGFPAGAGSDDQSCVECGRGRESGHLCRLCSGLEDTPDGAWEVIPINILSLTFEEEEEKCVPVNADGRRLSSAFSEPSQNQVLTSAFLQLDIFDTPAQQKLALKLGQLSFVAPSSRISKEQGLDPLESGTEFCSEPGDAWEM
ncbi:uncharacterized protein LOC133423977 [Cololabis saira]|uniref:uncharacterized protein LOC133423977 n=1 Tax=Cololabis saira TaxID=129043 RepID=UPI002AD23CFA|nr:uncharacterized protein LOC133423977 [Cololabis saira]